MIKSGKNLLNDFKFFVALFLNFYVISNICQTDTFPFST